VRRCGPRGLHPHVWEQVVLPVSARGGRLVNLAGSSPMWPGGQICMLHDAAVFDHPEAYTDGFVRWYRWLFRRQAAQARRLLTVSAFSQARLAACLGIEPGRIGVVPNGGDHLQGVQPDEAILDQHGLRGRPWLLAVASANPTKNLDRLVAAFASLGSTQDLRLVIVGGGNAQVFARAGAGGGEPGVVRTGPLTDAPLKALYSHARAFVFPSIYEGFGIPPLEAMACGCPVVAARAASIPEVCGAAALYFDPFSVPAIAAALRQVLDDGALRRRLQAAGAERVRAHTWAAAGQRLLAEVEAAA
jgi:glycosyltransferase involved in cell wall biosynthesis